MLEELARSGLIGDGLMALLLGSSRPLAFLLVTPLFTRFGLQAGVIRGALLLAFAAPILPGVYAQVAAAPDLQVTMMAGLILKELGIGLLLAMILGVPFWAISAAGDMIDMQRGASMAELVDPGSGDQTTVTGTLFFLIAALLLVSQGWFTEVMLASLYGTYAIWPVLAPLPPLDAVSGAAALGFLDAIGRIGLTLALPIFGPLFLTEIGLALAGKYTQTMNIMFLAMSVKQIVFCILLPIYFTALTYYMLAEMKDLSTAPDTLRGFIGVPE